MIAVATLAYDTPANVTRFVQRNLANGADHVFVVLDRPDQACSDALRHTRGATAISADEKWWGGRVSSLNGRQRVAANFVLDVCRHCGVFDWVFFIDADEVLVLDRGALEDTAHDCDAVTVKPVEIVATSEPGYSRSFKYLLKSHELRRLHDDGVIHGPHNRDYFRGHISGKVGIRVRSNLRFWVHNAVDDRGAKAPRAYLRRSYLAHCESPDLREFVRKWRALTQSGPAPGMKGQRAELFVAMQDAVGQWDCHGNEEPARLLFGRYACDPAPALRERGLLRHLDLDNGRQSPRRMGLRERRRLARSLRMLNATADKSRYLPGRSTHSVIEQAASLPE